MYPTRQRILREKKKRSWRNIFTSKIPEMGVSGEKFIRRINHEVTASKNRKSGWWSENVNRLTFSDPAISNSLDYMIHNDRIPIRCIRHSFWRQM